MSHLMVFVSEKHRSDLFVMVFNNKMFRHNMLSYIPRLRLISHKRGGEGQGSCPVTAS